MAKATPQPAATPSKVMATSTAALRVGSGSRLVIAPMLARGAGHGPYTEAMTLTELLRDLPVLSVHGTIDVPITGITADSRAVRAGDLFVALPGRQFDGHAFIGAAVAAGAAAIVCEHPPEPTPPIPVAAVADAPQALGMLASAFYGHPSRQIKLIGVTGTDGKTSTTTLTAAVLRQAGLRTAHLTTVEVHDGVAAMPNTAGFTTPQAMDVQRFLAAAVAQGCTAAVLEVSSHALATGRVAGCEFDIAVFTNLAPEHLDYHHTLEEYRAEKGKLFLMLAAPRTKSGVPTGIVNAGDPNAAYFQGLAPRCVTFGFANAGVLALDVRYTPNGTSFRLAAPAGQVTVGTRLLGAFNVENWLAAAAAALAAGAGLRPIVEAAARTSAPPGRLERLTVDRPFQVFVDFAHTPHGLAAALDALRPITPGRLIAVFGHAGRRDINHRRGLLEAARGRADTVILTMDDPYDEDPAAILTQMQAAAQDLGFRQERDLHCILDRREAFRAAFALAGVGDTVLLAGRGHETYIPLNGQRLPFHDPTVARELLTTTTA
ncbi:MAG: UDP-N-acetylmuramoyl-L-alanyl-D-glutamate--2,6-diaminopimelate ligase [Dehalococcoidia bacterium]|nr:UDP-N-acetylmuramoyl-L-alanyl-D-glutamate--2,6-diaminopimelate ligase [Dehalococcoidia bacterium]